METKNKTIFQLIPEAIGKIGAIPKGQRNIEQNYMFRGIDDFMNACNKVFSEIGIFCVPEVVEDREVFGMTTKGTPYKDVFLKMKYTFYASDGSNICAIVKGEARDYGDKATNKALSAAMKYALMQVFCITTKDNADTDKETPEPKTEQKPRPILSPAAKVAAIPAAVANLKSVEELNIFWSRCQPLMTEENETQIKELFSKKAKEFGAMFSNAENKYLCNA